MLRDNGWLCGFRVNNMDEPQVSAHQVAIYTHGTVPFIQEINRVLTETITTHKQREANYVHHGWSVAAVATVSPWTLSRIDATDRHNEEGTWITRRTLAQRLKVQVLPEDLAPTPEFKAAIEEALKQPTTLEKFRAVDRALNRWGDVVPLEFEMGSSLTLTDSEVNFNQFPAMHTYNSLTFLSTNKTACIMRNGAESCGGWEDGRWIAMDVPATEWRPIRISAVASTFTLLSDSLQAQLAELSSKRLSYFPPLTISPIRYLCTIYDDTNNASKTISTVNIRGSDYIDCLSLTYRDGVSSTSQDAGKGGFRHPPFTVINGEYIVEMLTCSDGEWVRGIQFITNTGRCSAIYGILYGTPVISRSKGGILAGFSINTKKHPTWDYLVAGVRVSIYLFIGFKVSTHLETGKGIWRHDTIQNIPKENDVYSDYFGAQPQHGTCFNDRALVGNSNSMYISNVEIRAGIFIDGIQFTYTDTRNGQHGKLKTPHHGGFGGISYQFKLGDGEHIISVSGKYNEKYLTQLCFVTNLGRTSEAYGEGSGQPFSARAPLGSSGQYLRLQYILGKSDNVGMNGVLFVWTPELQ
ncbi:hypothetical protein B0J17DRAFT_675792 [Rhizoctonia solani]|nr:hypothetical protein B0J17DRAFT_675792 [Rhizoctonia solani]